MENPKRYEILDALPAYGPMYIPVSADGKPFYSQGFVVKFIKSDGSEWVANFKPGIGQYSGVHPLNDTYAIFSSGTCYIMNPDITKPINIFDSDYYQVINSSKHQIIAIDTVYVTIIEPDGQRWQSERISWDGFKEIKLKDYILSGLSYDPTNNENEWVPFSLNIKTKEIYGGSYRQYEFIQGIREKPWWKFWK